MALGLVRPVRIDDFRLEGVALPDGSALPSRLEEGMGIREMAEMPKAPTRVTLDDPWEAVTTPAWEVQMYYHLPMEQPRRIMPNAVPMEWLDDEHALETAKAGPVTP